MRAQNILWLLAFLLTGCNFINPPEMHPVYVRIDSIGFSCKDTAGTSKQNIVDAWVFADGKSVGVYELPATFPVLKEGHVTIDVLPGIKLNGISATRAAYPFMTKYELVVNAKSDSMIVLKPHVTYVPGLTFDFIEDFEQEGLKLIPSQDSDTGISKSTSDIFEGGYSGKIIVDKTRKIAIIISHLPYKLPSLGYTFMEMHYMASTRFVVGMYIKKSDQIIEHPFIIVNPTPIWKKMYVNFTPVVGREGTAESFVPFFKLECPTDQDSAWILLDNVKLIHSLP
jgi:hypothetical protein